MMTGDRLGSDQILSLIGKGSMGEVYRARDAKPDRDVAIKVLPDALAQNAERLARFEREAKVLAALNHPNIAAILRARRARDRHGSGRRAISGGAARFGRIRWLNRWRSRSRSPIPWRRRMRKVSIMSLAKLGSRAVSTTIPNSALAWATQRTGYAGRFSYSSGRKATEIR